MLIVSYSDAEKLWFKFRAEASSDGFNLQGRHFIVKRDVSNANAVQQLHGGLASRIYTLHMSVLKFTPSFIGC